MFRCKRLCHENKISLVHTQNWKYNIIPWCNYYTGWHYSKPKSSESFVTTQLNKTVSGCKYDPPSDGFQKFLIHYCINGTRIKRVYLYVNMNSSHFYFYIRSLMSRVHCAIWFRVKQYLRSKCLY